MWEAWSIREASVPEYRRLEAGEDLSNSLLKQGHLESGCPALCTIMLKSMLHHNTVNSNDGTEISKAALYRLYEVVLQSVIWKDLPKIWEVGICRLKPQLVHCMVHRAEQQHLYHGNLHGIQREEFQILKGKAILLHEFEIRSIT